MSSGDDPQESGQIFHEVKDDCELTPADREAKLAVAKRKCFPCCKCEEGCDG